MDVSQLTDTELRDSLRNLGLTVGPIVATTRKIYEKKLLKMSESAKKSPSTDSAATDLNDSQITNGSGADAVRSFSPIFKSSSPMPVPLAESSPIPNNNDNEQSDLSDCEESMRFLTEEEMAADRAAVLKTQKRSGGIFGNSIAFAITFVAIAVFAYFLLENAEQLKLVIEPKSDDTI
ncbi:unnamed protein product [Caenorhabditis sp. 36 PRJEB53466]|nr:unnamed protein product [Caenorhabditis sp. 36 PRJEB53466]